MCVVVDAVADCYDVLRCFFFEFVVVCVFGLVVVAVVCCCCY